MRCVIKDWRVIFNALLLSLAILADHKVITAIPAEALYEIVITVGAAVNGAAAAREARRRSTRL